MFFGPFMRTEHERCKIGEKSKGAEAATRRHEFQARATIKMNGEVEVSVGNVFPFFENVQRPTSGAVE
jgi:hypothetical protein